MRSQTKILGALILGLVCELAAAQKLAVITGYAHDRNTGELIYTESHRVKLLEGDNILEHKTEYKTPDGTLICSKWLDYSKHRFAPTFELTDHRDGHLEGAEHTAKGYRLYSRADKNADTRSDTVKLSDDLVSDSGFDLYVRARMDALLTGKKQGFRMAVASEQAAFSFEAEMVEKTSLFGRQAIRIRVQPGTLLRLLVEPIYITYDIENGELLRYEGLTNIRDKTGNRHDARIDFPPDQQQYAGVKRR